MNPVLSYLILFGISEPTDFFSIEELEYIDNNLSFSFERENTKCKDEWGNFDEALLENTKSPYLDEFVLQRLQERGKQKQSIWPDKKPFAVCLTHDVDRVESYSPKVFKRNIAKRFKHSKSIREKLKLAYHYIKNLVKQVYYIKRSDAIWNFEKWEQIENQFGVKSTYFFFVRTNGNDIQLFDCDFALDDTFVFDKQIISVKDYIKHLESNGFEIGLHGSFTSAVKLESFKLQKQELERVLKKSIVSTRQHYLHYNMGVTADIHISNNILLDSSLGLNKNVGFRNGTSFPFILQGKNGHIWELPLLFMDSSILGNPSTTLEYAKKSVDELIEKVEKVGGCFTLNFHPDYVNEKNYFELYNYILEVTTQKNAYFGTCNEILTVVKQCAE